jgi:hypothetical protein
VAAAGVLVVAGALIATTFVSAHAATPATPTTPVWSTRLDFDGNGTAWSESSFATLKADGLTTAGIDLPWNTIEPKQGTFDYTELDHELANASAAGIQLIPIFWYSGWGGSPASWVSSHEETAAGAQGTARPVTAAASSTTATSTRSGTTGPAPPAAGRRTM